MYRNEHEEDLEGVGEKEVTEAMDGRGLEEEEEARNNRNVFCLEPQDNIFPYKEDKRSKQYHFNTVVVFIISTSRSVISLHNRSELAMNAALRTCSLYNICKYYNMPLPVI